MTEGRSGQFGVQLSDGMRITRLLVGWAAGHWWITFVLSGIDFRAGRHPRSDRLWDEIPDLLRLDDEAGRITLPPMASGDGGFGGHIYWLHYQFTDEPGRLDVSYLESGAAVASESLDLSDPPRPWARNDEAALPSVSAGQDRFFGSVPRRDSNPRYRLERANGEPAVNDGN